MTALMKPCQTPVWLVEEDSLPPGPAEPLVPRTGKQHLEGWSQRRAGLSGQQIPAGALGGTGRAGLAGAVALCLAALPCWRGPPLYLTWHELVGFLKNFYTIM